MTRAKSFALMGAFAASILAAGVAQAASPLTLKCVSAESVKLRKAISDARGAFREGRALCFGPGHDCAVLCQSNNDDHCNNANTQTEGALDLAKDVQVCNATCSDTQKKTIDACRSDFVNDKITQAQLDACANGARQVNLDCKIACTDQFDEARLACSQALSSCLGSCASCGSIDPCDPQ